MAKDRRCRFCNRPASEAPLNRKGSCSPCSTRRMITIVSINHGLGKLSIDDLESVWSHVRNLAGGSFGPALVLTPRRRATWLRDTPQSGAPQDAPQGP